MTLQAGLALFVTIVGLSAPQTPQQTRPWVSGSSIVSGVVVSTADPQQPVRRAIVQLSAAGELSRSAVTDDEGRFAIGFLPAGTYTLRVSKPAYLTTTFGALGPGRPGTTIVIRDGETIPNLRIPLTKGAAIAGTVRDPTGEAAEGVQVFAVRVGNGPGGRTQPLSASNETATTDNAGAYRIYGLAPGTYLVGALPRAMGSGGIAQPTSNQIDVALRLLQQRGGAPPLLGQTDLTAALTERFSYAPTYHPATNSATQAATVTVAPGEDRRGTDIFLKLVPVASVEGVVVGVDGQPAPNVSLNISTTALPVPSASTVGLFPMSPLPGPDGRFRYTDVAPGSWTITARSSAQMRRNEQGSAVGTSGSAKELSSGPFYWAASTVDVNGAPASVTLQLRPGLTMTGRVVVDSATPGATANVSQVRLLMTPDSDPARAATVVFPAAPPAVTNPVGDGTFELRGLTPGPWVLSAVVPGAPGGWWLRSALLNGQDLLDAPITVGDRDLTNVVITLSNRHTELVGTLSGADGKPVLDLVVVVMPADRSLWTSLRRVQQTRPATNGQFSFADLPAGTYLLAAAKDVTADNWRTPELLTTLGSAGVRVTLGEGEKKTQDVRIAR